MSYDARAAILAAIIALGFTLGLCVLDALIQLARGFAFATPFGGLL